MTRKEMRIRGVVIGLLTMAVGVVLTYLFDYGACQRCYEDAKASGGDCLCGDQAAGIYAPIIVVIGIGMVVYATGLWDSLMRRYRVMRGLEGSQ